LASLLASMAVSRQPGIQVERFHDDWGFDDHEWLPLRDLSA
jgi:hypothetical protein